jgi:phosphoribosyl 1,2-cyclic phosphodiesterase
VKVTLCGTRGSLATPGPDTSRYGGNTSCVEVVGKDGTLLALDAGTGIRRIKSKGRRKLPRVDLLLTHLHMDHIQGLGFFDPLYDEKMEVHIWGPASTTLSLRTRLTRYLSPPLFPVRLRDLPCKLELHEVSNDTFAIGELTVTSRPVCHPGPTVGYRISNSHSSIAYMPDHEVALGVEHFPIGQEWTSGYDLAAGVDLLIHDAQYTSQEYESHVGWGHSSIEQVFKFAELANVKHLVPFHHDPSHNDDRIDVDYSKAIRKLKPSFKVTPAAEGMIFDFG